MDASSMSRRWFFAAAGMTAAGAANAAGPIATNEDEPQIQPPDGRVGKADSEKIRSLRNELVEHARRASDLILKWHKEGGPISFEDMYRWSHRLLKAELDLSSAPTVQETSLKAHLERMKYAEDQAMEQAKKSAGRVSDRSACHYYRAQAELWLAIHNSKAK